MKNFGPAIALALLFAATVPTSAQLAPPYGPDCRSAGRGPVWVGTIRGQHQDSWDYVETRFQRHCFPSQAACERWLYAARTYYSLNFDRDRCQREQR